MARALKKRCQALLGIWGGGFKKKESQSHNF